MTDSAAKVQITKLNDDNYPVWKYKMELLLIKEELWNVIIKNTPVTEKELAIWNKKEGKARAYIGLFIEDNQIIHVKNKITAKSMWQALQEYHQKSTLSNKVRLLRRLCRMMLPEGGNMQTHLNAMDECMDQLATLGEPLADTLAIPLYLSSLSESYSVLITALESRSEADLTKNMVKNKLLEEYRRRQEIENANETSEKALKVSNNGKSFDSTQLFCFFCKKKGHIKADCRKFAAWKKKKDNENHDKKQANVAQNDNEVKHNVVCLLANRESKTNIPEWCVDSGASAHMCNDETVFKNLVKSIKDSVKIADGRHLPIKGNGTIDFETTYSKFRLSEVQFIPELECNLLSVGKLTKGGCKVVFKDETCEISKDGKMLLNVRVRNDVYKVTQKHQAFVSATTAKSKCIHEWHKVLGHRNLNDIRQMSKLAVNMNIAKCQHEDMCEICVQCKQTKDPFPHESFTKSNEKLVLIHTDVCGPLQLPTPRGNRYILTLIDDYSRYSHIYLIKHKSDVREKIIEFVEEMKTQNGKVPKVIRSDRGGEYMDGELRKYFRKKGIKTQLTVPKTPQQNGIAERKNRTLIEMTRCMLASSGLHKQFWGEAVTTANHIINRLPSKSVETTPYELWHNKQPNLNYFHTFGTPVFAHVPKDQRQKLDNTSEKLFFVGYEIGTKSFRLLNKNTNKIKISRDVKFLPIETYVQPLDENADDDSETIEEPIDMQECNTELRDTVSEGEHNEQVQTQRQSERRNKGIPPKRLIMEINKATKESNPDPVTYEEAIN